MGKCLTNRTQHLVDVEFQKTIPAHLVMNITLKADPSAHRWTYCVAETVHAYFSSKRPLKKSIKVVSF